MILRSLLCTNLNRHNGLLGILSEYDFLLLIVINLGRIFAIILQGVVSYAKYAASVNFALRCITCRSEKADTFGLLDETSGTRV